MPLATPQGSKEYNTGRKFALFVVLFEKYGAVLSGVPRNTFCVYPFRLPPWFFTVKAKGNKTQNLITEYFLVDKIILHYEDANSTVQAVQSVDIIPPIWYNNIGLVDEILSNLAGGRKCQFRRPILCLNIVAISQRLLFAVRRSRVGGFFFAFYCG